jgi:hypothetical protein
MMMTTVSVDMIQSMLVLPALQQVTEYACFVYGQIEDEPITFGQRLTIQKFTNWECIQDFWISKGALIRPIQQSLAVIITISWWSYTSYHFRK